LRSHFLASTTKRRISLLEKKTFHRRARVFLFFPAHHAARPTGDGARRQRRAGLVLLLLLGEARAPSPQQRRRPATTVRFVPAHRPRRQRHRGGVQGRRNRRGRLRRQHRRLLHDRQGGRWMEREAEREREKKKRKRATETTLESISPRGKRAPLLRAFRVSEAFFLFESEERVVFLAYERTEDDFVERKRCQRGSKGSIGDSGRSDDGARSSSFFLSRYLTLSSSFLSRSNPTTTTTNYFRARSSPPSARLETRSRTLSRR